MKYNWDRWGKSFKVWHTLVLERGDSETSPPPPQKINLGETLIKDQRNVYTSFKKIQAKKRLLTLSIGLFFFK